MYLAARNEHVKTKIKPALKQKTVVICDRFKDSSFAYQVFGKKVNSNFINNIHRYILNGLNAERLLIASECIGDAKYFINKSVEYGNQREVFGRPIGKNQGIQFPVAKAYSRTFAAELTLIEGCNLFNSGQDCGKEANISKLLAAEASWEAAEAAMQTFGGFSFAEEYNLERKFRETRLYQIAPVSTNMILAYVAHKVLGFPRSY